MKEELNAIFEKHRKTMPLSGGLLLCDLLAFFNESIGKVGMTPFEVAMLSVALKTMSTATECVVEPRLRGLTDALYKNAIENMATIKVERKMEKDDEN